MSEWKTLQLRALIKPNNEKNRPDLPLLSVVREKGVILRNLDKTDNHNTIPEDLSGYKVVRAGQFVINKMKAWQGSCGVSQYDGIVSPAYFVFDMQGAQPRFFNYAIRSKHYVNEFGRISSGIRVGQWDLSLDKLKYVIFPLPSGDEQDQIVRFLDWKVSLINKLINAKKRQVTLLREIIDTLANQAINQSQEKRRMKVIVNVLRDWIDRDNETEYQPIGVLNRGRGIFYKPALKGADLGDSEFFVVKPNSLMFSGQFAWEGAVGITHASEEGCIASHRYYTVQSKSDECSTEYLWAFFQTKYGDMILNDCSHGAAGRNRPLNFNELMNEYILMPTKELNEKITKLVRLYYIVRSKQKEFEGHLSEYRTRFISDVVTGKMDVRDAIIPVYEAVEETADSEDVEGDEEELAEEAGDV